MVLNKGPVEWKSTTLTIGALNLQKSYLIQVTLNNLASQKRTSLVDRKSVRLQQLHLVKERCASTKDVATQSSGVSTGG